jgi:hypothetical protein
MKSRIGTGLFMVIFCSLLFSPVSAAEGLDESRSVAVGFDKNFFTVRIGKDLTEKSAKEILAMIKDEFPGASIEEADIEEEKIVKIIKLHREDTGEVVSMEKFFTVHVGSYSTFAGAEKVFSSIVKRIAEVQRDYLRIEREVGGLMCEAPTKDYTIRVGKGMDEDSMEELLKLIGEEFKGASVKKKFIKKPRILEIFLKDEGEAIDERIEYYTVHIAEYDSFDQAEKIYRELSEKLSKEQRDYLRIEFSTDPDPTHEVMDKDSYSVKIGKGIDEVALQEIIGALSDEYPDASIKREHMEKPRIVRIYLKDEGEVIDDTRPFFTLQIGDYSNFNEAVKIYDKLSEMLSAEQRDYLRVEHEENILCSRPESYKVRLAKGMDEEEIQALVDAIRDKVPGVSIKKAYIKRPKIKKIFLRDKSEVIDETTEYFTVQIGDYGTFDEAEKIYNDLSAKISEDQRDYLRIEIGDALRDILDEKLAEKDFYTIRIGKGMNEEGLQGVLQTVKNDFPGASMKKSFIRKERIKKIYLKNEDEVIDESAEYHNVHIGRYSTLDRAEKMYDRISEILSDEERDYLRIEYITEQEPDFPTFAFPDICSALIEGEITRAAIDSGYEICEVIQCAVSSLRWTRCSFSSEQVVLGALEAGGSSDVVARCAIDAGAEVSDVKRILESPYVYTYGAPLSEEPPERIIELPDGDGQGGGFVSPSSF